MMKLLAIVLLAVVSVQSKKYIGGCVGALGGCGGGYAVGAVAAAPAVAVASVPVVRHIARAIPFVGTTETFFHSGRTAVIAGAGALVGGAGCVDTLTGCGGYASLGYCGRARYATGCCRTCGLYKKK